MVDGCLLAGGAGSVSALREQALDLDLDVDVAGSD